jgi:Ser/Thr protein kinase RdoA (MazF antagonist)
LDVPAVLGEIVEVDGRRGICYQLLDGDSMMQHIEARPLSVFEQAGLLGKLHAEMHSRQGIGLPSQREKLQYKIRDAEPLPDHLKEAALLALDKLPEGDRVCHGDFHPGNILMTPHGPVAIDWTDASCGNPLSDVARTLVLLSAAQVPLNSLFGWLVKLGRNRILNAYTHNYFIKSRLDRSQLQAWMPIVAAARLNENIPQENERLLTIVRQGLK